MCASSVSDVIYHKFSHGAASYTLSEENVNVMLGLSFEQNYKLQNGLLGTSNTVLLALQYHNGGTRRV